MSEIEQFLNDLAEGRQALAQGDAERALACAWSAYRIRKMDPRVWQLFAEADQQLGDDEAWGFWQGVLLSRGERQIDLPEDPARRDVFLYWLGYGASSPRFAPFVRKTYLADGTLGMGRDCLVGRQLQAETDGRPGFFVGVYNPMYSREMRGPLAERLRARGAEMGEYQDMTFDLMRAKKTQELHFQISKGESCILPIAGSATMQSIEAEQASMGGRLGKTVLGQFETTLLRMDAPVRITSQQPFWVGEPVRFGHSPRRRRVVLNILTDGLSWAEMKREDFENIPNIMRFFSEGTIFDRAYSGSEFTMPSFATIETGMLPHHSQIFSVNEQVRLEPEVYTLSEQMKRLGYYCVAVQSDSEGVFDGVMRGYDRILVNHYVQPAFIGVERVIRQLEAFEETDQFLLMHCADSHPYAKQVQYPENAQTQISLAERCSRDEADAFRLEASRKNQQINRLSIRDMDRQLGMLFDYLEENYDEEEFLVCLFSDHGPSVYSDDPWLLNEFRSNSTLMVRGGGVPRYQRPTELVSTADIYQILDHFCGFSAEAASWTKMDGNLPEVFGGKSRDMVISQSIYEGQTRKICLRTDQYACRFETEHLTRKDGTVEAVPFSLQIEPRGGRGAELDEKEAKRSVLQYLKYHADEFMLEGLDEGTQGI